MKQLPNTALPRPRSAPLRSPLSRKPFGALVSAHGSRVARLVGLGIFLAGMSCAAPAELPHDGPAFLTTVYNLKRYNHIFAGHTVVLAVELLPAPDRGGIIISEPRTQIPTVFPVRFASKRARDAASAALPGLFTPRGPVYSYKLQDVCVIGTLRPEGEGRFHFEIEDVTPHEQAAPCFRDRR